MFGKTYNIIAITKNRIVAAKVKSRGKKRIKKKIEYSWDYNTLDLVISKIKKELKIKSARILIGNDLSYVLRLSVPTKLTGVAERKYISKKISQQIPEVLGDKHWDYKDLHFNVAKEKSIGNTDKEVLVFSPVKGVFEALSKAFHNNQIKVVAVEPESVAKTRHKNAFVGLTLKKDLEGDDADVLNLEPLPITQISKESKRNENSLLVDEAEKMKEEHEEFYGDGERINNKEPESRVSNKLTIILVIILSLLLLFAFYYFYLYQVKKVNVFNILPQIEEPKEELIIEEPEEIVEITDDSEVEDAQEIVLEELDLSVYNIQIQNGSGVAGETLVVEETLLAEGFIEADKTNADNYDYQETVIKLKDEIDTRVFDEISRALNSDYVVSTISAKLSDDSIFDAVVIVGERLQ